MPRSKPKKQRSRAKTTKRKKAIKVESESDMTDEEIVRNQVVPKRQASTRNKPKASYEEKSDDDSGIADPSLKLIVEVDQAQNSDQDYQNIE